MRPGRSEVTHVSGQTAFGFSLAPDVVDEGGRLLGSSAALGDNQCFWW